MNKLIAKIGLRSAIILVVSVIVGSGVFKKMAPMSAELGSPTLVIACWVLAGFISLAGALSTAEMAGMFPDSGGEYHYFQRIYGRFFAFLYGWGNFTVMKSAAIAALAYIFAQSLNSFISLPQSSTDFFLFQNYGVKLLASFLIFTLSFLNYRGVIFAERLSTLLTSLMILSVLSIIFWGFFSGKGSLDNLTSRSVHFDINKLEGLGLLKAMTIASLGAFWGYEGWNQIGYIGEEVKNPKKNLPLALGIGTLIVIVIYVLLNTVFAYIFPIDYYISLNSEPNKIVAVEVANKIWGSIGAIFVACLIMATTLNSANSSILLTARILYAMARDGMFFKSANSIHPKFQTPYKAIFIQAMWASLLVWSGSFDLLTNILVFAAFIFYGATALGVIILRIKEPDIPRTYRVFAYPFMPVIFLLFSLLLLVITTINQPKEALLGLGLIATGIPFYLYWRRT
ncbi:MAG: APC family permease [Saprospiraceae bacterium]|jgi:APA family basic amino acid/polyamine antiporter|nr:amino acid permease [Bacteroidota bacterium]